MNPLNYASIEASKRLVDNGIVLETDMVWLYYSSSMILTSRLEAQKYTTGFIAAPSMAEVWRELPNNVLPEAFNGLIRCRFDKSKEEDYLISLLIWVKKEKV